MAALKTATKEPSPISEWGITAHGAFLDIAPKSYDFVDKVLVIDVENNQDGSCAGIGVTEDGRNIQFFSGLPKGAFSKAKLIGHNIKYDVQMLRKWGFNVSPDQIVWDTQVAEYVKDSTTNAYGLKDLAYKRFGAIWPTYKELCGTGKKAISIGTLPVDLVANYNGCDVLFTYKLYQHQMMHMTVAQIDYMRQIELPTLRVLLEMEERGVQIDTSYIRGLDSRFAAEIGRVSTAIRNVVGAEINLNSHQQIKRALVDKIGLHVPSTAAEELHKHEEIPLVKDILRYRGLTKLKGTYTSGLLEKSNGQETYRLHARFNQTITHTGRLSSSDPNLQNIPTRTDEGDAIRRGFVAREGYVLIDADYSQIEPRLMAHFSEDPNLMDIFNSGRDLYDAVAEYVGCTRAVAKTLWLALAYNAGAYKISKTAGISVYKAQEFLDRMREVFGGFFYWKDKVIKQAEIDGYVTTMFGRKIPLSLEWAHLAPNYMVQGSAAEVMKLAAASTSHLNPVSTVHDELLFEVPRDEHENSITVANIKTLLESVVVLTVPLIAEVGIGANWREAKN